MPWVERKKVPNSLCCAESGHLSPAGLSALSSATWYFCFCFLNNNVFLKLCIWITHYYGNVLFCFVLKEREKRNQSQGFQMKKWINQWKPIVVLEKNNLKHMFGNYCYHRHPFHMWNSGYGKRPAQENISNKKGGKLRSSGFSQAVILKCNLFEGFISQANTVHI